MVGKRTISKILLVSAVFLSACSAVNSVIDSEPVGISPAIGSINAAAERAAAEAKATNTAVPADAPDPTASPEPSTSQSEPTSTEEPKINPRVDVPEDLFVNWLIPWDGIRPVYEPRFVPAGESPLQDNELIIGVSWEDEAKAYPITVLRFREMVNDELAGIPTLVTW
jgi:hypothetical protein